MLPIGCPPAIPESVRPGYDVNAAAVARARPVHRIAAPRPVTRRVTVTVEPSEPVHPMRVGTGMLIDTFA